MASFRMSEVPSSILLSRLFDLLNIDEFVNFGRWHCKYCYRQFAEPVPRYAYREVYWHCEENHSLELEIWKHLWKEREASPDSN